MKKNLLIYSTTSLSLPHLGIEMESINRLSKFYNLHLVYCNGSLKSCYFNPCHNVIGCSLCISRTEENIVKRFKLKSVSTISRTEDSETYGPFSNSDELMNFSWEGYNIGRGVASSIISILRDVNFDPAQYKFWINTLLTQSISVVKKMEDLFKRYNLESVLLFNGRFAEVFPVLEYCRKNNIEYYTHEKGANFTKYQLIKNSTVHDISTRILMMNSLWNNYDVNARDWEAVNWFQSKRKGTNETETNYTSSQTQGKLPLNFDEQKHNIIIYNSSEDEFKCIPDWSHDLYSSQLDIIVRICKKIKNNNIQFYLRFHPNLKGISKDDINYLNSYNFENLEIIAPESKIDSYTLLQVADKVLTFGSRMSLEAAHEGKSSIIYGKSFYNSLNSLYTPDNFDKLIELLINTKLIPKSSDDFKKAALFLKERGNNFLASKIVSKNHVFFHNKKLSPRSLKSIFKLLSLLKDLKLWKYLRSEVYNDSLSFNNILKLRK